MKTLAKSKFAPFSSLLCQSAGVGPRHGAHKPGADERYPRVAIPQARARLARSAVHHLPCAATPACDGPTPPHGAPHAALRGEAERKHVRGTPFDAWRADGAAHGACREPEVCPRHVDGRERVQGHRGYVCARNADPGARGKRLPEV